MILDLEMGNNQWSPLLQDGEKEPKEVG